ncbi:MAG TPA: hypothetical protein VMF13_02475, partial [Luteitalea sp.]|nr:hypothetical protein [Luteitalea sp.]
MSDVPDFQLDRRAVLAALASSTVAPWLAGCSRADDAKAPPAAAGGAPRGGEARKLLDECAEHLLAMFPESATSLGVDTGTRAALRSRLADRSEAGKQHIAEQVRADLA